METMKPKRIGGMLDKENETHQIGSVWDISGLAPTLDTMQGGWRQPLIIVEIDGNEKRNKKHL